MSSDDSRPDAFIQWKGTDVCLDLYCTCGQQFHFDGDFAYELTCGDCGQTWEMPHKLLPRAVEPSRQLKLILDGKEIVQSGEFEVPWPRPEFSAVKPGEVFEIHDENQGVYADFLGATPNGDGTMTLKVRNRGYSP